MQSNHHDIIHLVSYSKYVHGRGHPLNVIAEKINLANTVERFQEHEHYAFTKIIMHPHWECTM